ncbi:hypothetical protein R4Z09_13720 [Niallia oryzisoli]|uniref:Uncharacterized protein n=1 Tax=Niallia oryzisoli TaxID=1737571 RepID=A0ABZ2CPV4_9BACI
MRNPKPNVHMEAIGALKQDSLFADKMGELFVNVVKILHQAVIISKNRTALMLRAPVII